ncbi:hypothetical protein HYV64_02970 [Candidatus Shapirobacteria bacterium]|nr:hypothetical protein [Candidatus Shapirobacteria bacterium]
MSLKTRFFRTFANLPIPVRNEVAVVVDGQPISWNVLKLEVESETKVGMLGLEILDRLGFLKIDEK